MTTINFTFPAPVADFLNLHVPGFATASGGGDTVALQVPVAALPAPVVAGLDDAGIQVAAAPATADPVVSVAAADAGRRGIGISRPEPASPGRAPPPTRPTRTWRSRTPSCTTSPSTARRR